MLVAISAASDGVAALLSETKSAIVVSVSCPIAVIIGILELYICLAKNSLLYSIKSSSDPPPLAIIITSEVFFLFILYMTIEANNILSSLGFLCKKVKKDLKVKVPSWRPDINQDVDLIEELIRIKGFKNISLVKVIKALSKKKYILKKPKFLRIENI